MSTPNTPNQGPMKYASGQQLGERWRAAQALRMAWQSSPRAATLWMVLLALSAILPLCVAWVGKSIVDAVVAQRSATRSVVGRRRARPDDGHGRGTARLGRGASADGHAPGPGGQRHDSQEDADAAAKSTSKIPASTIS